MPSGYAFAQLEAPTAYLSHDFSAVSWLDVKTGKTLPGSSGMGLSINDVTQI
jgi:hypothetical protein